MNPLIVAWLYWTAALTALILAALAFVAGYIDRGVSLTAIGAVLLIARAMTLLIADQQQIRLRTAPPRVVAERSPGSDEGHLDMPAQDELSR